MRACVRAWVRAQDWEDNVDTKVYMKLLTGLRKAFDAATPSKKYLITVAPGWPRYPWDASANGVVDAFDMMSYSNSLQVRKRVLLRHFHYIKTIILPRQARDKHRVKALKKETRLSCRDLSEIHTDPPQPLPVRRKQKRFFLVLSQEKQLPGERKSIICQDRLGIN